VSVADSESQVELRQVSLRYGAVVAVDALDLRIEKGSFCTLLGPSGCGKTTLLRAIAGLVAPRAGDILISGRRVNDIPIHRRNIGLVFQNYALFPHKSVFDNVAFGLKYRNVDRGSVARRVAQALEVVRLPHVERRLPAELSGGQQQRVALARAIVIKPDVLLLDEPLSALDANLREDMRGELKNIQRELGITTVFVTHDQEEALAISDCVVVMNRGRIEQVGTPEAVYGHPQSRFVADFLGRPNVLAAELLPLRDKPPQVRLRNGSVLTVPTAAAAISSCQVEVVIRADRVMLEPPGACAPPNGVPGRIVNVSFLGATATYVIEAGGIEFKAVAPIRGAMLQRGAEVQVGVRAEDCALFDLRAYVSPDAMDRQRAAALSCVRAVPVLREIGPLCFLRGRGATRLVDRSIAAEPAGQLPRSVEHGRRDQRDGLLREAGDWSGHRQSAHELLCGTEDRYRDGTRLAVALAER
jgi:ABC-type Fe3+/spermidine/putrescine transport system ATPase subunit